jgi:hypothetical protein
MVYNRISTRKGIKGVHYNYQKSLPIEDTLVETLLLCYVLNQLNLHFKTVIDVGSVPIGKFCWPFGEIVGNTVPIKSAHYS